MTFESDTTTMFEGNVKFIYGLRKGTGILVQYKFFHNTHPQRFSNEILDFAFCVWLLFGSAELVIGVKSWRSESAPHESTICTAHCIIHKHPHIFA